MSPAPRKSARPNAVQKIVAMTLDERREHLAPARQAIQYKKAQRLTRQILACDPPLTADQLDALCALLRGESQ